MEEKIGITDLKWTVRVPVIFWWVGTLLTIAGLIIGFL